MKGHVENFGWTLAFELAPSAIFGCAAAFAASKALALPQVDPATLGTGIGLGSFCASLLFLRLFRGNSDDYVIPMFDLGAFDGALVAAAEAVAEEPVQEPEADQPAEAGRIEDELVLDDV